MTTNWFDINKDGLSKVIQRRGKSWAVLELIQNAFDTDASRIEVELMPVPESRYAELTVTDNSTEGFSDITHAWTLFTPSEKAANPELRGRFNLGDKLVLALATEATIVSTTAAVGFSKKGRRRLIRRTESGTVVKARIRLTQSEVAEMLAAANSVIVPEGVLLLVNKLPVKSLNKLGQARGTLATELADENGVMKRLQRVTAMDIFESTDETPTLFELGMPVGPSLTPWHISVNQTVPLGIERGEVSSSVLRAVHGYALEVMAESLTPEQAKEPWVEQSLPLLCHDAVKLVCEKRFGRNAVVIDPSDPEANKRAMGAGRTVVPPKAFSKKSWGAIREARRTDDSFLQPAGRAFSRKVETSANGKPPIDRSKWTAGMTALADYSSALATRVGLGKIGVSFYSVSQNFAACATSDGSDDKVLSFNVQRLGHKWIDSASQEEVDQLLIHEFAHLRGVSDHLSDEFHRECCQIGAALRFVELRLR